MKFIKGVIIDCRLCFDDNWYKYTIVTEDDAVIKRKHFSGNLLGTPKIGQEVTIIKYTKKKLFRKKDVYKLISWKWSD